MSKGDTDGGTDAGRSLRGVVKLSPAEAAVVAQLARGLSNKEIARALGKAPATVKSQLTGVYRKLGVRSRIRLMVLFRP
jgi:two-component system nitrate/nitrite response regulator NarL